MPWFSECVADKRDGLDLGTSSVLLFDGNEDAYCIHIGRGQTIRFKGHLHGSRKSDQKVQKKWVKVAKTYKHPVIKSVSPGDMMYSTVTTVNNTVLCISKLLRKKLKVLITIKNKPKRTGVI